MRFVHSLLDLQTNDAKPQLLRVRLFTELNSGAEGGPHTQQSQLDEIVAFPGELTANLVRSLQSLANLQI